jgi:hypothetical protein
VQLFTVCKDTFSGTMLLLLLLHPLDIISQYFFTIEKSLSG